MKSFREFLASTRVKKGEVHTHGTKGSQGFVKGDHSGSYFIAKEDKNEFLDLYCEAVNQSTKNGKYPTVTEKSHQFAPLRVDVDMKWDPKYGEERRYDKDEVCQLIEYYQDEIKSIVHRNAFHKKMLMCVVLEKEEPRIENGMMKDGFHLHFPHFICDAWTQDSHLYKTVRARMIDDGLFGGKKLSTSISDLIDTKMFNKPWLMYGSVNYKSKDSTPYAYIKRKYDGAWGFAVDHDLHEIDIKNVFIDEMRGLDGSVYKNLPRLLSIRDHRTPSQLRSKIAKLQKGAVSKKRRKRYIKKIRPIEDVVKDLQMIKNGEVMEMLSAERAEDHHSWMDVGWTLFNIGQGHEDALEMWIEFSRRSSKFQEGECEEKWDQMEMRGKTLGSLLMMAKEDSPDEYKRWRKHDIRALMRNAVKFFPKPNETSVARVVYKMYGDKFICADPTADGEWWFFESHRWHEMQDGLEMRLHLINEVVSAFHEFKRSLDYDVHENKDLKDGLDMEKKCSAIIVALQECTFINKVMRQCKLFFTDKKFYKNLNENRNILCCENGVLDLELGVFRSGRPDDYCSFTTGQFYHEYAEEDEEVVELREIIRKYFPNPRIMKYSLDFHSSCLRGGNLHKKFVVGTGDGDNGKSKWFDLLEEMLNVDEDGYIGKFPREFLLIGNNKSSSGPREDLCASQGKRLMTMTEITHMEKLDIGVLKEMTGSDKFRARGLYAKRGKTIRPQFTFMMQCNEPPKIPGSDQATWNRIRVLPFESTFVMPGKEDDLPVPEDPEEQFAQKRFRADQSFSDSIPEIAPVLLWLLFDHYCNVYKMGKNGLFEPKEVKSATKAYREENDIYEHFIRDKVEEVDERGKGISKGVMYSEFQEWYRENYPSYARDKNMSVGRIKMVKELVRRMGGVLDPKGKKVQGYDDAKNKWYGFKIKIVDEPEEENVFGE